MALLDNPGHPPVLRSADEQPIGGVSHGFQDLDADAVEATLLPSTCHQQVSV